MDLYQYESNGKQILVCKNGSCFYRQSDIHEDFEEILNNPENNIEPYPEFTEEMHEVPE